MIDDQYMYIIISQHSYKQYYSIILLITYWMRYLKQFCITNISIVISDKISEKMS